MYIVVLVVAVFIISLGISVVIVPLTIKELITSVLNKKWLWPVSIFRVLFGICFLMASNQTTMPEVVNAVGIVLISVGLGIPMIGSKRIEAFALILVGQKDWIWRIFGFIGMLLGIGLALAGLPAH